MTKNLHLKVIQQIIMAKIRLVKIQVKSVNLYYAESILKKECDLTKRLFRDENKIGLKYHEKKF